MILIAQKRKALRKKHKINNAMIFKNESIKMELINAAEYFASKEVIRR